MQTKFNSKSRTSSNFFENLRTRPQFAACDKPFIKTALQQPNVYLSYMRRITSKPYLVESDIQQFINFITISHVSVFKHLSLFFKQLRLQLKLSDQIYKENIQSTRKMLEPDKNRIFISKYFNKGLSFGKNVFFKLYLAINNKFALYANEKLWSNFIHEGPFIKFFEKKQNEDKNDDFKYQNYEEYIFNIIFPEAYQLQKTIRHKLDFMRDLFQNFQQNIQPPSQSQSEKDKVSIQIYKMVEQGRRIIQDKSPAIQFYENGKVHFSQNEFFDIKQFYEKFKFYLQEPYEFSSFNNVQKLHSEVQKLKMINNKCIDCLPFAYFERNINRQRCQTVNFVTFPSVKDVKRQEKRFRQLLQGLINNKNGGSILFDCKDQFFGISPKGLEMTLRQAESRKQSLMDLCANYFKDLKIGYEYSIDFLLIKNIQKQISKIKKKQQQRRQFSPSSTKKEQIPKQKKIQAYKVKDDKDIYVTRMKILKKLSPDLRFDIVCQKNEKKVQINDIPICYVFTHHFNKLLSKYEFVDEKRRRRFNFERLSNNQNKKDLSQFKPNFWDGRCLQYLQGRSDLYLKHESSCKQPHFKVGMVGQQSLPTVKDPAHKKRSYEEIQRAKADFPYFLLLVVNIHQKRVVQRQLQYFFGSRYNTGPPLNEDRSAFVVQAPFQGWYFNHSKNTLLVRSNFHYDEIIEKIKSRQAVDKNMFRTSILTQSRQLKYNEMKYIKVYDMVYIEFFKMVSDDKLYKLKLRLQKQLKQYHQTKEELWSEGCQVTIWRFENRPVVFLQTKKSDSHPSYALLFIYNFLKNYSYTAGRTNNKGAQTNEIEALEHLKSIQFRTTKDFNKLVPIRPLLLNGGYKDPNKINKYSNQEITRAQSFIGGQKDLEDSKQEKKGGPPLPIGN